MVLALRSCLPMILMMKRSPVAAIFLATAMENAQTVRLPPATRSSASGSHSMSGQRAAPRMMWWRSGPRCAAPMAGYRRPLKLGRPCSCADSPAWRSGICAVGRKPSSVLRWRLVSSARVAASSALRRHTASLGCDAAARSVACAASHATRSGPFLLGPRRWRSRGGSTWGSGRLARSSAPRQRLAATECECSPATGLMWSPRVSSWRCTPCTSDASRPQPCWRAAGSLACCRRWPPPVLLTAVRTAREGSRRAHKSRRRHRQRRNRARKNARCPPSLRGSSRRTSSWRPRRSSKHRRRLRAARPAHCLHCWAAGWQRQRNVRRAWSRPRLRQCRSPNRSQQRCP
mmetsp:Transcript_84313/g.243728  ORF Transcript_84313/g.243728 Transcript_84313/m.243728 type:complete len:345 (+) Transcript_84313:561-1595(+)